MSDSLSTDTRSKPQLRRTLGFWALAAYGIGDILGAGIYALVGKVAGVAGTWAWLGLGVAMAVAGLTALSYAELVTRFPKSGGEAYYCQKAFNRPWISLLIGWMVFCSGVVSLSTVTRGFAGYVEGLWAGAPGPVVVVGFLVFLGFVNFWGIRESSAANIVCTVIEASGLLFVLAVGTIFLTGATDQAAAAGAAVVESTPFSMLAIIQGAALAFFAFIGFEDMVNIAEETKEPERNFPKAIIAAVLVTGVVYMFVAYVATSVVPPAELGQSEAPLLDVVRVSQPDFPEWIFTLVALFAVGNTGLLNFIMASRLIYGMANEKLLPSWLGVIHTSRLTPYRAILVVFTAALILSLSGTLTYLAGTTSVLLLVTFAVVNAALIVVKRSQPRNETGFQIPIAIPAIALLISLALAGFVPWSSGVSAGVLIAIGAVLVGVHRARG